MTEVNVEQTNGRSNLFLSIYDVMLAEVIDEARQLGVRFPGIPQPGPHRCLC